MSHALDNVFVGSAALIICLAISSCVKDPNDPPSIDKSVDYGAYYFNISGGPCGSTVFEGDSVRKTDWDPTTGFIYLENDPDYDTKQIMTMYLYYDYNYSLLTSNPLNSLSTSCVAFGPTIEALPRLYRPEHNSYHLDSVVVGSNFIAGKIVNWKYDRVLVYPEDKPETVTVNGHFVAKMR